MTPPAGIPPENRPGPLSGIRVLDLTSVLMGPFATQTLGEMGADIIKIESPKGDTSRDIGARVSARMGANFLHVNRYKRSVVLDLKSPQGRDTLLTMVRAADVLFYNIRPAAMARLGLSYDDVCAVNPRIIYAGVFGYGEDGPYSGLPAYDDLIQGAIGLPDLMAKVSDGVPRYVPLAFVDRAVGLAAVNAVCAALLWRANHGTGQAIAIPMFETVVPFVLGEHFGGASFDPPTGPAGYSRLLAPERRPYRTADGFLCAVIYTDRHWRDFYALTGRRELFDHDDRVRDMSARTTHMERLCAENAHHFLTATTEQWFDRLRRHDIPCMVLNDLDSLLDDPHLKAVNYFETVEHPTEGAMLQMRPSTVWSTPFERSQQLAPHLGEHTSEVLQEFGLSETRIAALLDSGVATQHSSR